MSFNVSLATLKTLGLGLDAEDIGVYLLLKTHVAETGKYPSRKKLEEMCPGSARVLRGLKKKKLLLPGTPSCVEMDAAIKRGVTCGRVTPAAQIDEAEALLRDQSKIIALTLRDYLLKRGIDIDDSWIGKNRNIAKGWLREGVDFNRVLNAIAWIFGPDDFASTYLAPHCHSLWKLKDYYIKYQENMRAATPQFSHDAILDRRSA